MQKSHFILGMIALILAGIFISIPACTSTTDCNCTKRPDKFHLADFQTDGVVFEWGKDKVDLQYELIIQELDDKAQKTRTYSFSQLAADLSSKVIKWDDFFKQKHTYRAWLKSDCTKSPTCSEKAFSPNSDTVVFSTFLTSDSTLCPPPVLTPNNVVNNTGSFSWTPISAAQGYFIHIVNSNGSSSTTFTTSTNGTVLIPTIGSVTITVQTLCDSIGGIVSINSNPIVWTLGGGGTILVVDDDLDICPSFGCDSTNFEVESDASGCISIKRPVRWCFGTTDLLLQLRDLSGTCLDMPKRTEVIDFDYVVVNWDLSGTLIYVTTTPCENTTYSATILPYSSRECSEVSVTSSFPNLCK